MHLFKLGLGQTLYYSDMESIVTNTELNGNFVGTQYGYRTIAGLGEWGEPGVYQRKRRELNPQELPRTISNCFNLPM